MYMNKFFFFFAIMVPCVMGWGPTGHNMTAKLAYENLSPNTKKTISNLHGYDTRDKFAAISNWADEVKSYPDYAWSYDLHFVDIDTKPLARCEFIYNKDCKDDICVVGAVNNYTENLIKNTSDTESLKFLVHFLGDIFQPFHVSYTFDRGGNNIHVHFLDKKTNLHAIWDTKLLEYRINQLKSETLFLNELWKGLEQFSPQIDANATQFAQDSLNVLCNGQLYYDNNEFIITGDNISMDYYNQHIEQVRQRLISSAYFMSKILDQIFSPDD